MMQADAPDNADAIALPPLIYGAALAIGLVLHGIYPIAFLRQRLAVWVGVALIGVSIVIVGSALRAMARAKTPFDIRKPTTAVVTDGAFRYSRNPMYVSLTLLYLGIASLVNTLWLVLLLVPLMVVIQRGVVRREERYLEGKFGQDYGQYKRQVRRWI